MKRRDFLGAGVGLFASGGQLWLRRPDGEADAEHARLGTLGVQLYTVRHLLETDFEGTLRQVAECGYRQVEFAGYYHKTPREVREILDRYHLQGVSSHIDIALLDTGWDRMLEDAHTMGHRYLCVAWTPVERRRTIDDWKRIGELFNRAGRAAHSAGIQFAYHNHDYEFPLLEGQVPYDVLIQNTDPEAVQLELDLYWIRKGGRDPLEYFRQWPHRFPMVHVKDMSADGQMVDVGAGAIDWRAIFAHRREAGIRHYFVEHDEPADAIASIRASFNYLNQLRV